MKQIGFLQLLQVAVNRFVVQRTVLRFQIIRNGFCREGVAHIVEGVLDHSFQLVDLPHLIALDNIREDRGVVNIPHDGVDLVLRELLQMRCRETAQAHIISKLCLRLSNPGILTFEHQVFAKGQGEDAERHIPSRQIGRYLRGHHSGVGACHIQVNIEVRRQRIDDLFPALDFLHLIKKQIGFSIGRKTLLELCVHLLCRHILIFH